MQINPLKQLYTDFIKILDQATVKYKSASDKEETLEIKKEADSYVRAYLNEDKFETYYYDKKILKEVLGIDDDDKIDHYYFYRNQIPDKYKNELFMRKHNEIINDYEEKNNYYRMLNGMPNYGESENEYIYIDKDIAEKYKIPSDIPIHKLDDDYISFLRSEGYLDVLLKKYPSKKYIKYIGDYRIDIDLARRAKYFSLLRIPTGISEALWNTFSVLYDQSREYFMSCIYVPEYTQTIEYYDNFIAMCIMVMAIQQTLSRVIKNTIERDFFDEYCIKLLFDTYGIPYDTNMDRITKSQIVQNLNLLIQNKGTNKVIFDIASIVGYDRLKVFKYYIMKSQKIDNEGFPIIKYKKDDNDNDILDYKEMYDVYFQKVNISENNLFKALDNTSNKVLYEEVVEDDPFWIEDDNLFKELYETEYNYAESKYMGITISYKMTKILFENAYIIKMIFDNKDKISHINLNLPKISLYSSINVFDAIVTLCALVCKQNNLKGNILYDPSKILHVLGFNFSEDFSKIAEDILNNHYSKYLDPILINFLKNPKLFMNASSINNLYNNYINLYDVLVKGMSLCDNLEVYNIYKKLYETFFYTNENKEVFAIYNENDEIVYAETFEEYLKYKNLELYNFINESDEDEIGVYINHITTKLLTVFKELRYLGVYGVNSSSIENTFIELIRFFKSYTTDLINRNVIYIFDLKPENILKLIDNVCIHKNASYSDNYKFSYQDHTLVISTLQDKVNMELLDNIKDIFSILTLFDNMKFAGIIKNINKNIEINESFCYNDILYNINTIHLSTDLLFSDDIKQVIYNIETDDKLRYNDNCNIILKIYIKNNILLYDIAYLLDKHVKYNDNIKLEDNCVIYYSS